MGIGVLIGCSPFYGFHLALCILAAWLFRLNRMKTYLAAHISLPGIWPLLVLAELQLGRLLRGAPPLALRVAEIRTLDPWSFAADLLLGSAVVGVVLGALFAYITWRLVLRMQRAPEVEALLERAARPFVDAGISHWEFVRGKLRHDPAFFGLLRQGVLPRSGRLLDLGCGRGILLALLAAAKEQAAAGAYPPDWPPPPDGLTLAGIEGRKRTARAARKALGALDATSGTAIEIVHGDLREVEFQPARAMVLLDVLHYLPAAAQEALLDRAVARLEPGGVLLIREADAAGGAAFRRTRAAERLRALLRGTLRQRFCYRSREEWEALLQARRLAVSSVSMSEGTPYANVLLVGRRASYPLGPSLPAPPGARAAG